MASKDKGTTTRIRLFHTFEKGAPKVHLRPPSHVQPPGTKAVTTPLQSPPVPSPGVPPPPPHLPAPPPPSTFPVARQEEGDARYQELLQSLYDAALITDMNGQIQDANRRAMEFLRFDPLSELCAHRISDVIGGSSETMFHTIRESLQNKKFTLIEASCNRKDQTIFPAEIAVNKFHGPMGEEQLCFFIRDISQRKLVEAQLQLTEARNRAFMNAVPELMFRLHKEGTVLEYKGPRKGEGLPVPEPEMAGRHVEELFPGLGDWFVEQVKYTIGTGQIQILEYQMPQGQDLHQFEAWVVVSGPNEVMIISRDITERRRAETELARFTTAVEQSAESILIIDLDGYIQYVNPVFEKTSGFARDQAIGQHIRSVQGQRQDEEFHACLWKTLQEGKVWRGQFLSRRVDGGDIIEMGSITPVVNSAGQMIQYVIVKTDVTRERQMEDQLRQAQKMESIGQLAGGIAHDFNNIIGVIIGYSSLLLRDLPATDPAWKKILEIHEVTQKATQITQRLLAFSRQQLSAPQVIDLNAHLKGLMELLQGVVGENTRLTFMPGEGKSSVNIDPNYLEQAVMSLLINSREAMPEGGNVRITVSSVDIQASRSDRQPVLEPRPYVTLEIKDTGMGMTPEVRAHAFEPFFSTKGVQHGTGLGLFTVYGIVEQSGGYIDLQSQPGAGATFTIYLPYVPLPPERQLEAMVEDQEAPRGSETIFVVEDQESVRKMACVLLGSLGYQMIEAQHAEEALELLKSSGSIHLLFTDLVMPGMDGLELAQRVQSQRPDIKLLFTSGYAARGKMQHGLLDPARNFLAKPYELSALARKIRDVLDGK